MNWARVIVGVLVIWATTATAWGYRLTITTGSYLAPAITVNPASFSFTARRGAHPAPRTFRLTEPAGLT